MTRFAIAERYRLAESWEPLVFADPDVAGLAEGVS